MGTYFSRTSDQRLWLTTIACLILFFLLSPTLVHSQEKKNHGEWKPYLRLTASMTELSSSHTQDYPSVSGISGTNDEFSWIAKVNGNLERRFARFEQDHRLKLEYGRTDGVESQDEIDFNNILRWKFGDPAFFYGGARVRSVFDTFGHPTNLNSSAGLGTRLLESDTYGELELRTGPRGGRKWNPSTDWELFYELIMEYDKTFDGGSRFQSQLETFTLTRDPDQYTVRWENSLVASVNSWLDVEYSFTTYYENEVGELATKSLATVNLSYQLLGKK